jgi:hypothetical protein
MVRKAFIGSTPIVVTRQVQPSPMVLLRLLERTALQATTLKAYKLTVLAGKRGEVGVKSQRKKKGYRHRAITRIEQPMLPGSSR